MRGKKKKQGNSNQVSFPYGSKDSVFQVQEPHLVTMAVALTLSAA
jgi:hypothetical protein